MTTYADLKAAVLRALRDPAGTTNSSELVWDGVVDAHRAIMPWVPKFSVVTLTSGSGGGLLVLPADTYQVDAVQDLRTNVFLPKATLAPKYVRSGEKGLNVDWLEYPTGSISISEDLDEGVSFKVFYRANWSTPTSGSDGSFVIEVPTPAHTGMIYYACAHVLIPRSVGAAGIRQYNTRTDSGNPEDNPMERSSDFFRKLFYAEMKMMPNYLRGVQG